MNIPKKITTNKSNVCIRRSPIITFVIATLNGAKRLPRCLDSIFRQSIDEWEIVVIDGGSQDGTIDIIEANCDKINFWVSEPDSGVYDAWNKGLLHCNGEWILFLGADDYLSNDHVLENVAPILTNPDHVTRIMYGKVNIVDDCGRIIKTEGKQWEETKKTFFKFMSIFHQGVFHHYSIFKERGFDCQFKFVGDYELLLSEIILRKPIFIPQIIACWAHGGLTSSPRHALEVVKEMKKAKIKHNIKEPIPIFLQSKVMIKKAIWTLFGQNVLNNIIDIYRLITMRKRIYDNNFTKK